MDKNKLKKEYLIPNLARLKQDKNQIYKQRISLYLEMMNGGNGGIMPDGSEFRKLHFHDWSNKDFAILLIELGELDSIPEELEKNDYPKKNWFSKLFSS
jgi:hypothetical protein